MDLLRWPVVGALARWRHGRLLLQLPLLAVAVAMVAHGFYGPGIAPRNLATVLAWVHYRGLLVVALLAIGNLFCTGCPMVLVRDAGRRIAHPALRWPRVLRTKWPAIVLFAAVLFAYELFDLWSLPRATAWLIVGYFAGALTIDVLFAGASFCKYICPIGQFNFIASTLSPTELQVRDLGTCRTCRTVDCIKGRRDLTNEKTHPTTAADRGAARVVQRGCELGLFLPSKVGNLDCTMCLDCVHACPHDNIALVTRLPGDELSDTRRRSGIGRLTQRKDIAALAVLFVFGALINAFAMTSPAVRLEQWVAGIAAIRTETLSLGLLFLVGLVALPLVLIGTASAITRLLAPGTSDSVAVIAARHAYGLVPLGFGIWCAHYGFHLLTGALTIIPVAQSAMIDLTGQAALGEPLWTMTGMTPGLVFPVQLGCLVLGALGSLAVTQRITASSLPARSSLASLPWTVLVIALSLLATWTLVQPMEMRAVGLQG
jgi:ferredoxin